MSRGASDELTRLLIDAVVAASRDAEGIALADNDAIAAGTDARWDINLATALERAGLLIRKRGASALAALDPVIDRFNIRMGAALPQS